ncbi:protein BTG1 [Suricata suricatta]|nr:protein BTG1 [Suricata suricatta]
MTAASSLRSSSTPACPRHHLFISVPLGFKHLHPNPAAPHEPPAWGASLLDWSGNEIETPSARRDRHVGLAARSARADSKTAFIGPAQRLPASEPGQLTPAGDALARLFPPPPAPNLLRHNGAISGLAAVSRHAPATPLPFRGAIKATARLLHPFAPPNWKCNSWELRRLRSWTRRRLGKSERCDQAAVARLFLSPAASRRPGRPRSGPAAGAGQARLAADNGGSRRELGVWAEGAPCPHGCPTEGRRKQAHNKETTATEAGAAVLGPSADLGTKELRSWEHYKHHWFPEKPCKGSGYRCIRINHKMDPLIGQAAQRIGLSSQELFRLLPSELTLWVDPYEVSYRIGEDGSICVLYEASPAGGSTQNSSSVQMVDSRISCKEELLLGRTSPSKNYNMMTVSG